MVCAGFDWDVWEGWDDGMAVLFWFSSFAKYWNETGFLVISFAFHGIEPVIHLHSLSGLRVYYSFLTMFMTYQRMQECTSPLLFECMVSRYTKYTLMDSADGQGKVALSLHSRLRYSVALLKLEYREAYFSVAIVLRASSCSKTPPLSAFTAGWHQSQNGRSERSCNDAI